MWRGGFGTAFSLQNTLQRAAPLILTALCVALPARLGLVIIGGEGALVLGGLAAAALALPLLARAGPSLGLAGDGAGRHAGRRRLDRLVGALRHYRGVNETISSLLLAYIAIAAHELLVEGAAARPGQPQQALDPADRRRLLRRRMPGTGRALGPGASASSPASSPGSLMSRTTSASPRGSPAATRAPRRRRACRSAC